jgi:hypothetical protein
MLTPLVAVAGYDNTPVAIQPDDLDSPVGILPGHTIKYTITTLDIPMLDDIPDITLPDLAGIQLYVKVLHVNTSADLYAGPGTGIHYAVGLMFPTAKTITYGTGITSMDFTIPAGAATPSLGIFGSPNFNISGEAPTVFVLSQDWAEHETFYEAIGFTVVNGPSTFQIEALNNTGQILGTWRKSDGLMTQAKIDNIVWGDFNATGIDFQIDLTSLEYKPIAATPGTILDLQADITDLEVSGSGELYTTGINQTIVQEIQDELAAMKKNTVLRFVVDEVAGCYVKGTGYAWDIDTHALSTGSNPTIFNAFFGCAQQTEPPMYTMGSGFMFGFAPVVTPDWDIYAGMLKLANFAVSTGVNEYLDAYPLPEEYATLNTLAGSFELTTQRAFKFLQFGIAGAADINMTDAFSPVPPGVYDAGIEANVEIEGYLGYHETGIMSSARLTGLASASLYAPGITGAPTGTITVEWDIKLRNPSYNPPDPIGRGFIPGFTWVVAIPALVGIAAFAIIRRRK